MKLYRIFYYVVALIMLTSCTSESTTDLNLVELSQKSVVLDENFKIAMGQTIYVPIYSHIYHENEKKIFDLAATLSIRNSDLENPIAIASVEYYDQNGKLLKKYLEHPIEIAALASTDFFVDTSDRRGGSGAKFIVKWVAETTVTEPIVEAIMIGTAYQQGISFISSGKVIKNYHNSQPENLNR